MRNAFGLGLLLIAAGGCGEEEPTPIGCDFFVDEANCWAVNASFVDACVPREGGTFNAERTLCTFSAPSDVEVHFASSVPLDPDDGYLWDFQVPAEPEPCVRFTELGPGGVDGYELASASIGTTRVRMRGDEMVLTCHGGERYSMALSDAMACADLSSLPGFSTTQIAGAITFHLTGTYSNQPVFACGP